MQALHAANLDHVCPGAPDIGSHAVQEVGNIYYMRLFCHIFHDGQSICHRCSHHDIDGSSNAYHVKIYMLAHQTVCFGHNLSILNVHIRAQSTESLDMLIYRPAANIASARKCNFRPLILSKQGAQKIIGCADLLDVVVFYVNIVNTLSINLYGMTVNPVYIRADA